MCPKNPPKGTWISIFKPTRIILKLTYLQNYYSNSNRILHSNKDHQVLFVGGPNTRITNPRWQTAAVFKNRHISAAVRAILTKFGTVKQFDLLDRSDHKKTAAAATFKNWKQPYLIHSSRGFPQNLAQWRSLTLLTVKFKILKIQYGGSSHLENRYILATIWPILTKFDTVTQSDNRDASNR